MREELLGTLFLSCVNRAIAAGWLVLVVLLLRLLLRPLLRGAPKWCCLWLLVGVRLLLPRLPKAPWSMLPSAETIAPDIMYAKHPQLHTGIAVLNDNLNPVVAASFPRIPQQVQIRCKS